MIAGIKPYEPDWIIPAEGYEKSEIYYCNPLWFEGDFYFIQTIDRIRAVICDKIPKSSWISYLIMKDHHPASNKSSNCTVQG